MIFHLTSYTAMMVIGISLLVYEKTRNSSFGKYCGSAMILAGLTGILLASVAANFIKP